MKKYISTESQVKTIVDNLLREQTDIQSTTAAVQCFLNQVLNANLVIDGKSGPGSLTEKSLMLFQQRKANKGAKIEVDGVWGYNTQATLTPEENRIWKKCVRKYERP